MTSKSFDLDEHYGKEYAGHYELQEISWAKRSRIIQAHTRIEAGEMKEADFVKIQAKTIMATIKEQPKNKPITLEKLLDEDNGIPNSLGEFLSKLANKVNGISVEDIRFLLEQLGEEDRTHLFLNFGYVKNSVGPSPSLEDSQHESSKNS